MSTDHDDATVEAVAAAITEHAPEWDNVGRARAAISAHLSALKDKGMVVVPAPMSTDGGLSETTARIWRRNRFRGRDYWSRLKQERRDDETRFVASALAAFYEALTVKGYSIVQTNPTPSMIHAARTACRDDLDPTDEELAAFHRAMIADAEGK